MPKISVVIPCYFNEGNIPVTVAALLKNEKGFSSDVTFEYVFVDDGSQDGTLRELRNFHEKYPSRIKVIELSKNVGSYSAICAGFEYCSGNCIVVISADLQDPPELIKEMYNNWLSGSKLTLGVRERRNDPFLTKVFAEFFYTALGICGLSNVPKGGFDFCLFDHSLLGKIKSRMRPGINSLLLLLQVGETPSVILYTRRKREIGQSQWTFTNKLKLALNTLSYFLLKKTGTETKPYTIKQAYGV